MAPTQSPRSWLCPSCRTENFGSQSRCLRCGAARPTPQTAPQAAPPPQPPAYQPPQPAGYSPPAPRRPAARRPGWLVPCLALAALGFFGLCTLVAGLYVFREPLQAWLAGGQPQAAAPVATTALRTAPPTSPPPPSQATAPAAAPTATRLPPQPTAAPTLPPPSRTPEFPLASFEGIRFRYHPQLASSVVPLLAEASNEPGWVMPAFYEFDFFGYVYQAGVFSPNIIVLPAQEYRALDASASEQIPQLQAILAQGRAGADEPLPLLPAMMAAQLIRARVEVIPFQNGSGLRYLTQLAQDSWPINNEDLFYTFQGLTSDGRYYVSAIFPVSHPDLPATGADYAMGDYLQFSENFAEYAGAITQNLNQASPSSFTPDLNRLDEVLRSLQVER